MLTMVLYITLIKIFPFFLIAVLAYFSTLIICYQDSVCVKHWSLLV